LAIGIFCYMVLIPVAEASEQTVLQRVVPFEKQGRVFGFAQSVEVAAAPVTAFVVGPVAEFWLIPYSASDAGRRTLEPWLGQGNARGMALVFVLTGVIGLLLTLAAFVSRPYHRLSATHAASAAPAAPAAATGG
jgi:DHA3 family multidrug efflux protein-like MFS transporter